MKTIHIILGIVAIAIIYKIWENEKKKSGYLKGLKDQPSGE